MASSEKPDKSGARYQISECFPKAIRISDRLHVRGYLIERVQVVRKPVQSPLQRDLKESSPSAKSADRFLAGKEQNLVKSTTSLLPSAA